MRVHGCDTDLKQRQDSKDLAGVLVLQFVYKHIDWLQCVNWDALSSDRLITSMKQMREYIDEWILTNLLEVEAAMIKRLVIVLVKHASPDPVHSLTLPFPACSHEVSKYIRPCNLQDAAVMCGGPS